MTRLVVVAAVVALAACQLPGTAQGNGCSNVQIDWVDFVQVGSTQYVAGPGPVTELHEADLGPVVAHVKFKVDGNVCDPAYRPKDGDAAFLEPGTPVYQVSGQPVSQLVAARRAGVIEAYRAQPPST
ncbi:MAG TPA: hypothetical protein VFL29_11865 [Candidatus Dormibacteraeota bacterium]|nr:hypothetical protein [Candidatus Dormibacteraeota bacterium]